MKSTLLTWSEVSYNLRSTTCCNAPVSLQAYWKESASNPQLILPERVPIRIYVACWSTMHAASFFEFAQTYGLLLKSGTITFTCSSVFLFFEAKMCRALINIFQLSFFSFWLRCKLWLVMRSEGNALRPHVVLTADRKEQWGSNVE